MTKIMKSQQQQQSRFRQNQQKRSNFKKGKSSNTNENLEKARLWKHEIIQERAPRFQRYEENNYGRGNTKFRRVRSRSVSGRIMTDQNEFSNDNTLTSRRNVNRVRARSHSRSRSKSRSRRRSRSRSRSLSRGRKFKNMKKKKGRKTRMEFGHRVYVGGQENVVNNSKDNNITTLTHEIVPGPPVKEQFLGSKKIKKAQIKENKKKKKSKKKKLLKPKAELVPLIDSAIDGMLQFMFGKPGIKAIKKLEKVIGIEKKDLLEKAKNGMVKGFGYAKKYFSDSDEELHRMKLNDSYQLVAHLMPKRNTGLQLHFGVAENGSNAGYTVSSITLPIHYVHQSTGGRMTRAHIETLNLKEEEKEFEDTLWSGRKALFMEINVDSLWYGIGSYILDCQRYLQPNAADYVDFIKVHATLYDDLMRSFTYAPSKIGTATRFWWFVRNSISYPQVQGYNYYVVKSATTPTVSSWYPSTCTPTTVTENTTPATMTTIGVVYNASNIDYDQVQKFFDLLSNDQWTGENHGLYGFGYGVYCNQQFGGTAPSGGNLVCLSGKMGRPDDTGFCQSRTPVFYPMKPKNLDIVASALINAREDTWTDNRAILMTAGSMFISQPFNSTIMQWKFCSHCDHMKFDIQEYAAQVTPMAVLIWPIVSATMHVMSEIAQQQSHTFVRSTNYHMNYIYCQIIRWFYHVSGFLPEKSLMCPDGTGAFSGIELCVYHNPPGEFDTMPILAVLANCLYRYAPIFAVDNGQNKLRYYVPCLDLAGAVYPGSPGSWTGFTNEGVPNYGNYFQSLPDINDFLTIIQWIPSASADHLEDFRWLSSYTPIVTPPVYAAKRLITNSMFLECGDGKFIFCNEKPTERNLAQWLYDLKPYHQETFGNYWELVPIIFGMNFQHLKFDDGPSEKVDSGAYTSIWIGNGSSPINELALIFTDEYIERNMKINTGVYEQGNTIEQYSKNIAAVTFAKIEKITGRIDMDEIILERLNRINEANNEIKNFNSEDEEEEARKGEFPYDDEGYANGIVLRHPYGHYYKNIKSENKSKIEKELLEINNSLKKEELFMTGKTEIVCLICFEKVKEKACEHITKKKQLIIEKIKENKNSGN